MTENELALRDAIVIDAKSRYEEAKRIHRGNQDATVFSERNLAAKRWAYETLLTALTLATKNEREG